MKTILFIILFNFNGKQEIYVANVKTMEECKKAKTLVLSDTALKGSINKIYCKEYTVKD